MIGKLIKLILLIIIAAVVVFYFWGRQIIASAMENVLGTPVEISTLTVNPFSSELGVGGFKIKNPSGFQDPILASIPEFYVRYSLKEISKKVIRIEEIRLNLDEAVVEKNGGNQINLMQLKPLKSPKAGGSETPSEPAKTEPSTGKSSAPQFEVKIDKVVLSLGRAKYVDSAVQPPKVKEIPLAVKEAALTNVTSPTDLVKQIVVKILQKVGLNALLPPDLSQLGSSLKGQASVGIQEAQKAFKGFADSLKPKS